MAVRLSRLVGLASLGLVLARLGRVLNTGADTPDWRLVALVAAFVGALVTWVGVTNHGSGLRMALIHLTGLTLVVLRVTAAPTLTFGVIPGADTFGIVATELGYAIEILQFGAPPVLAVPGLLALVAVGLWLLGAIWAWGGTSGKAWLGIVAPLGFYLYLSVMDRAPAGLRWNLALGILAALGLLATSQVSRTGAGRVRDTANRPLPRRRAGASAAVVALVVLGGLGGAGALGSTIPRTGTIDWRNPGGSGDLGGGVSFNRFVGLHQSLLSQSKEVVFYARVEGDTGPPTRQMYWKLLTLDVFDGTFWRPGPITFQPITEDVQWEDPEVAHRGETVRVSQTIGIENLSDDRLPALYSPVALSSNDDVITSGAEVGSDASLRINALTFEGLTYGVVSEVPTLDVASLASDDGELSPLFEAAAAAGQFEGNAVDEAARARPPAIDAFLELPENLEPAIESLARDVTSVAVTPAEQALLLEDFFLDFTYSTQVSSGHSALDLAEWLTVPASRNYRTGYCEQFATAMAVMGRMVGLPTRVVMGFTHGERLNQEGGPITVVRQRNAHAWVEVWFDQEGWVRFDPTPRGDGTTSPASDTVGFDPGDIEASPTDIPAGVNSELQPGLLEDLPLPGGDLLDGVAVNGPSGSGRWLVGLVVVVMAAAAVPFTKRMRRGRRLRRARQGDISAVWDEIVDRLSDLGAGPAGHETPIEFASSTNSALVPLAQAYSAAIYGGHSTTGTMNHLRAAERWIGDSFDNRSRNVASFSLRSLTRKATEP